jgi:hypothetical protein
VSDTSNQQNPKSFKIMSRGQTIKYLNITIIAGGTSKMEDPERFFKAIIFKTHDEKYLITKHNQYKSSYGNQVHPYKKEADSLFDLYPWICIPYQS